MEKKNRRLVISEEFKLSVLRDYYSSGMSKRACRQKYGLSSPTMLNSWLKKYSYVIQPLSLQAEPTPEEMSNRSKESYREENAQLKKRIKELEKALSFSRLETEARDLMITARKNTSTFPSEKNLGPNSNGAGQGPRPEGRASLPSVWPLPPGFYQLKADIVEETKRERVIIANVQEIRREDPGIGGYKLWIMLCALFGPGFMPGATASTCCGGVTA